MNGYQHIAAVINREWPDSTPGTPELVRGQRREIPAVFVDPMMFILKAIRAIPPATPPETLFGVIQTARDFRR